MQRQNIQLLALARQGDAAARCEAGRRYLRGTGGFPKHVGTGIEYLTHSSVRDLPQAAGIIAESLELQDIVRLQQESTIERAAAAGSATAQVKLAAWLCIRHGDMDEGRRWLETAAASGHPAARRALAALRHPVATDVLAALLRALTSPGDLDGPLVALMAVRLALDEGDLEGLARALRASFALTVGVTTELAEIASAAVELAERRNQPLHGVEPKSIEACLDMLASRGHRYAAYTLGRALCGIACGPFDQSDLVCRLNMRKGAALLLRAADGGCDPAWLQLHRLHSDHDLSVANPQMARFCLEKAALAGLAEAQRKLGALLLRASASLGESEKAIHWLHQAAEANDQHAKRLLESLVLPVPGNNEDSSSAIERMRCEEPWLAARLDLARHFGLTKLEALCVDPAAGLRTWGLVVGKNPFLSQPRLSAARAIPALSASAMDSLRRAAGFFSTSTRDVRAFEGDLRRRSSRQRRAFVRHGLDEAFFFASATSMTLEALRVGPKWAFRSRSPLRLALAA